MKDWKVLLVDDEKEFVVTLAERLGMRGIYTETAFNGEEALKKLQNYQPDVVVLDLMMPGMSGPTLWTSLAKEHPALRCLLISGYPSDDGAEALEDARTRFLQKPFTREQLAHRIRETLDAR